VLQTKGKDGAGLKLAMCVHNAFLCLLSAAMFAGAGYEVCACVLCVACEHAHGDCVRAPNLEKQATMLIAAAR
jgi:hypothetical protein